MSYKWLRHDQKNPNDLQSLNERIKYGILLSSVIYHTKSKRWRKSSNKIMEKNISQKL